MVSQPSLFEIAESGAWTSLAADFPANRSAKRDSDAARLTTAISGRKCLGLFAMSGQLGCLARMLVGSSLWRSTLYGLTWKIAATPSKRSYFRLAASALCTNVNGVSSWPTPRVAVNRSSRKSLVLNQHWSAPGLEQAAELSLGILPREYQDESELTPGAARLWATRPQAWPTPTARDHKSGKASEATHGRNSRPLSEVVTRAEAERLPTPHAHCYTGPGHQGRHGTPNLQTVVADSASGQLNPDWVELLMGFPHGWTNLD